MVHPTSSIKALFLSKRIPKNDRHIIGRLFIQHQEIGPKPLLRTYFFDSLECQLMPHTSKAHFQQNRLLVRTFGEAPSGFFIQNPQRLFFAPCLATFNDGPHHYPSPPSRYKHRSRSGLNLDKRALFVLFITALPSVSSSSVLLAKVLRNARPNVGERKFQKTSPFLSLNTIGRKEQVAGQNNMPHADHPADGNSNIFEWMMVLSF